MNEILFSDGFQDLFELNTNIFDTNLINLSIVLFVVIRFLGEFLSNTLETRRKLIIDNLQNSNKKILLVKDELNKANLKLENTKLELTNVYDSRLINFQKQKTIFLDQVESYLIQINSLKDDVINGQTKKVLANIYNKIVASTFDKLYTNITFTFQNSPTFLKRRQQITSRYVERMLEPMSAEK